MLRAAHKSIRKEDGQAVLFFVRSGAEIQFIGAKVEEERGHLITVDARIVGAQKLVKAAVARGDVLLVAPDHGLCSLAREARAVGHHLPQLLRVHIGVDAGHTGEAVDQDTGGAVVELIVVAEVQRVVLAQEPRLIGPAHLAGAAA